MYTSLAWIAIRAAAQVSVCMLSPTVDSPCCLCPPLLTLPLSVSPSDDSPIVCVPHCWFPLCPPSISLHSSTMDLLERKKLHLVRDLYLPCHFGNFTGSLYTCVAFKISRNQTQLFPLPLNKILDKCVPGWHFGKWVSQLDDVTHLRWLMH